MNAYRFTRTALASFLMIVITAAGFAVMASPAQHHLIARMLQSSAPTSTAHRAPAYKPARPMVGFGRQAAADRPALKTVGNFQGFTPLSMFAPSGRYLQSNRNLIAPRQVDQSNAATTAATPILIDEGVQTFDVFAPPPTFQPASLEPTAANGPALTPTNKHLVWSADQTYFVFSSNRSATNPNTVAMDGHFHLWACPSIGAIGGAPTANSAYGADLAIQITTGAGDEDFPALNAQNSLLAFTSTAVSSATSAQPTSNLYTISFNPSFSTPPAAIDPSTLTSTSNLKTLTGNANPGRNFGNVFRPTWSPGSNTLVFAADTISGTFPNHVHLYYLYAATDGYLPQGSGPTNPPVQLTDGPCDDADPAWSPDGHYIAFDSTATKIANTGSSLGPTGAPSLTAAPTIDDTRSVYLIADGTSAALGAGAIRVSLGGLNSADLVAGGRDSGEPAWSSSTVTNVFTNPTQKASYLAFSRGVNQIKAHDIYYFRISPNVDDPTQIAPETDPTVLPQPAFPNTAIHLNTSEYNDGIVTTSPQPQTEPTASYTDPGNIYDDRYPAWSPFRNIYSIAYQSDRSITYVDPRPAAGTPAGVATTPLPVETATSIAPGVGNVGPAYEGLLQSEVLNLDPPTALRFSASEIIHINPGTAPILPTAANPTGSATRQNIQPGNAVTFTVRLSDREAGIDPTHVFLQIKDPDSKYQDQAVGAGHTPMEHKVFARDVEYQQRYGIVDSGSSNLLNINEDFYGFEIANIFTAPRGAWAGWDTSFTPGEPIYIGTNGGGTLEEPSKTGSVAAGDGDPANFIPWGPEYDCQVVNPSFSNGTGDTVNSDYVSPYYTASFDDSTPFSGSVDTKRPDTEWLPMHVAPVQDGLGGVLYTVSWTTPTSPSDYYLDVIAYDKAAYPNLPSNVSPEFSEPTSEFFTGNGANWRIYDNIWGFTTAAFDGGNDILVVSDNTLGQKFSAGTFGGTESLVNLRPVLYGAESYVTDIDVSELPNCVNTQVPVPGGASTVLGLQYFFQAHDLQDPYTLDGIGESTSTVTPSTLVPATTVYGLVTDTQIPPNVIAQATISFLNANNVVVGSTTSTTGFPSVEPGDSADSNYAITLPPGTYTETVSAPTYATYTVPQPIVVTKTGAANRVDVQLVPGLGAGVEMQNGLGVDSYIDETIDDNRTQDNRPNVHSQRYSLWRILARGPIDANTLAGYLPTVQTQPAVAPVLGVGNITSPQNVTVANRCVLWIAPFTGDLFVGPGSLADTTTQTQLQQFVQQGGRLFVTGQDVASTLTANGTINNGAGTAAFLPNVLSATLQNPNAGAFILAGNGGKISGGYALDFGDINVTNNNDEIVLNSVNPQHDPLILGNDLDTTGNPPTIRLDSSLDQLFPQNTLFGTGLFGVGFTDIFSGSFVGAPDVLMPQNGANSDTTYAGGTALLTNNYRVSAAYPLGGRIVYAGFGMEGISQNAYEVSFTGFKLYCIHNQRTNLLHNIVSYLRTGSVSGVVRDVTTSGGVGVQGATVYVYGSNNLQYSATTDANGNYTISGLEPDAIYFPVAYKTGYTSASSEFENNTYNGTYVEGDITAIVPGLSIQPLSPGSITGQVTIAGVTPVQGIGGAQVTFTSADGQSTVSAITNPDGTYSISNVPVGTYTGVASDPPNYANATVTGVVVQSQQTTAGVNFPLPPAEGSVTGTVRDATSNLPINNATVTITPSAAPITIVTKNGVYTASNLPPGTYTLTASAPSYQSNSITVVITAGLNLAVQDIFLSLQPVILPGTIGGLVTDQNNAPLPGAIVQIFSGANLVIAVPTSAKTNSPSAPNGDGNPLNYAVPNLPPGTYTVTASKKGYIANSVTATVTADAFTRADVQIKIPPPIYTFPAGLNFVSVPYDYTGLTPGDPLDYLFGPLGTNRSHVAIWQPLLNQYVLDPTPPADSAHLGLGYWVRLTAPWGVAAAGSVPTSATVAVGLNPSWNMIGVPSTMAIDVSALEFANPVAGQPNIPFAQASSTQYSIVNPILYSYDPTTNAYQPVVATDEGTFDTRPTTLQPWQAYWIQVYVPTTILIPTN